MLTEVAIVHSLLGSGRRNLIIWSVIDFASNRLDLCMANRSIVVPSNRWHTKRKMDFNAPAVRNMPVEHVSRKQERKKSKTEARGADKTERGALWAAVSEKAFLVVGSGCSIVEEPSIRNSSYLHPPAPQSVHQLLQPFDGLFEAVPVEGEMAVQEAGWAEPTV